MVLACSGWIIVLLLVGTGVARLKWWIVPLFLVTLPRFKFPFSPAADSPPHARCGAMCPLCISYHKGTCPSCEFGDASLRESCPIFQCAQEKDIRCTICPEMLHCTIYRKHINACPFMNEVLNDTLPEGAFLIEESFPEKSVELFTDRIVRGDFGLIILRQSPDFLQNWPQLENVPTLQLGQTVTTSSYLDPTNLAKLHLTIQEIFEAAPRATVFLEGMEYLIVHNGSDRMLKFIHSVADYAKTHSSRFLTLMDPRVLEEEELILLERELALVRPK